jgi:hypothetical protein
MGVTKNNWVYSRSDTPIKRFTRINIYPLQQPPQPGDLPRSFDIEDLQSDPQSQQASFPTCSSIIRCVCGNLVVVAIAFFLQFCDVVVTQLDETSALDAATRVKNLKVRFGWELGIIFYCIE